MYKINSDTYLELDNDGMEWSKRRSAFKLIIFILKYVQIRITRIIIKITISSVVIGLKNSYFPLIHSPVCYRTV